MSNVISIWKRRDSKNAEQSRRPNKISKYSRSGLKSVMKQIRKSLS